MISINVTFKGDGMIEIQVAIPRKKGESKREWKKRIKKRMVRHIRQIARSIKAEMKLLMIQPVEKKANR